MSGEKKTAAKKHQTPYQFQEQAFKTQKTKAFFSIMVTTNASTKPSTTKVSSSDASTASPWTAELRYPNCVSRICSKSVPLEPESITQLALAPSGATTAIEPIDESAAQSLANTSSAPKTSLPKFPAELRMMILRECNLTNNHFLSHPEQTFYGGPRLSQYVPGQASTWTAMTRVQISKSSGDIQESAVNAKDLDLPDNESHVSKRHVPICNEHVFEIGDKNIHHLANWPAPKPLAEYQRVVLRMLPESGVRPPVSVQEKIQRIHNFLFRFTHLRCLRVHWANCRAIHEAEKVFGAWMPPHTSRDVKKTFFSDPKSALFAGLPRLETLAITMGDPRFDTVSGHDFGWSRGLDGRVGLLKWTECERLTSCRGRFS